MKLRLLKVIVQPRVNPVAIAAEDWQANQLPVLEVTDLLVQPVFALDDGVNLRELPAEPVVVPAAEWPTYAVERFAADFDALCQQFEAEPDASG